MINLKPIFRVHKLFNYFCIPEFKVGYGMLVRSIDIDILIKKTIEDVLADVFGEEALKSMLHFIETTYSFRWEDVSRFSEAFDEALRAIFGEGSTIIECLILERLCLKLKLKMKPKGDYRFSDCIKEMRGLRHLSGTR